MTGAVDQPVTDAELQAYADDRLPVADRLRVEAWLLKNPDAAAKVAAWQDQAEALRQHFAPGLDEPVPAAMAALFARPKRGEMLLRQGLRIAAVLCIALLGAAAGWWGRGYVTPPVQVAALPQEATRAHLVYSREVLHPVEVTVKEEQHLVAWLSKRLGTALRVPSLTAQGYALVGGRLLPASSGNHAAAQFMYENRQGQRLTLYVRTGETGNDTAFRFSGDGAAAAFYWVDGGFGYALAGETGREALLPVARSVYESLTR
ncbi:MAG: anti-sigma factor family protein [Ferrovibrio sp.]|uniref:anti-sigma factor family protein n=1 Tax=Ferrovibrio sp. TaxID=1917215 RepID=UPI00391ABE21